jgi:PPOX class probable F420-dependent enzyme
MLFNPKTEFGARVARRLQDEEVIWLVTLRADLTPQPSPVWFYWDGESFLIYSQPDKPKLRNIRLNPVVALHLDSNGSGGDIVIFTGEAHIDPDTPPPNRVDGYLDKYREEIADLGYTPKIFAESYSVPIHVQPTNLRGH